MTTFDGATMRLYGADILIVLVPAWVLADPFECQLLVFAFRSRFQRTIVLVAQDTRGVPTYYGPAAIARALRALPFDALTWRRYVYRKPPPVKLPIPVELPAEYTDSNPSWSLWPGRAGADVRGDEVARRQDDPGETRLERGARAGTSKLAR